MNTDDIRNQLKASADVKLALAETAAEEIERAGRMMVQTYREEGRVFLFGNGGSAADAQHIATELAGRYLRERRALTAIALTTNSSLLTAVANDYGYDHVFARQVEAHVVPRDLVIGISTSGCSINVIRGLEAARERDAQTLGLCGEDPGDMAPYCDLLLKVPSRLTPRIQEAHIAIGHILCDYVETTLFDEERRRTQKNKRMPPSYGDSERRRDPRKRTDPADSGVDPRKRTDPDARRGRRRKRRRPPGGEGEKRASRPPADGD